MNLCNCMACVTDEHNGVKKVLTEQDIKSIGIYRKFRSKLATNKLVTQYLDEHTGFTPSQRARAGCKVMKFFPSVFK